MSRTIYQLHNLLSAQMMYSLEWRWVPVMSPEARPTSEFERALRGQVDQAREMLAVAQRAGHDYEAHLHAARIQDLLDLAARHGIGSDDWVEPALLASARLDDWT
jgi:hypothetical protein